MRRRPTTPFVVLVGIFLAGCHVVVTPHAVLIDVGDPAFNRVTDGDVVLTGESLTLTQRQSVVSVVEGTVRAVLPR